MSKGSSSIADMLVFALLAMLACSFLTQAGTRDDLLESVYASSFAKNILITIQNTTSNNFGGFEYSLLSEDLAPMLEKSALRNLRHKTLAQLLIEDAICNMHLRIEKDEVKFGIEQEMDTRLKIFLKKILDNLISPRFGYRLRALAGQLNGVSVGVHFDFEIENLGEDQHRKLCSESVTMCLPLPINLASEASDAGSPKILIAFKLNLELWSR